MENNENIIPFPWNRSYAVNRLGEVFSRRPINGKGPDRKAWRRVFGSPDGSGRYLQVTIERKKVQIHRIVALVFIGICPDGFEVSHINGNSRDNRSENLEYTSHAKNESMKRIHGTAPEGSKNAMAKLTEAQVMSIRDELSHAKRGTARKIAARYGVSESIISEIRHGKIWNFFKTTTKE